MAVRETDLRLTADDGVLLVGTLAAPDGEAADVAALLLNGSGPLDRNSNMAGQALEVASALASALAVEGIASLRFDKRGVGESDGDYLTSGFDRETDDADAALSALLEASGKARSRLVVVGHSVGATIAMRLAARHDLAGVVLLAGAAVSGAEVMRIQSEAIARSLPWLQRLVSGRRFLRRQAELRESLLGSEGDVLDVEGGLPARWFREFMVYDPAQDLRAIRCPVLAVTGRKDLQVDAGDVERIGSLVAGPFTGSMPEDLTHLLRRDHGRPGLASYRRQLREPVDAALVEQVASWIAAR
jgi:pimeloyl-ACP methyl ester carboxylesterase